MKDKEIIFNGQEMYMWLLDVNALKKAPLERVMSYEKSPVLMILFANDGTSELIEKIQSLYKQQAQIKQVLNCLSMLELPFYFVVVHFFISCCHYSQPGRSRGLEIWQCVSHYNGSLNTIIFDKYHIYSVE